MTLHRGLFIAPNEAGEGTLPVDGRLALGGLIAHSGAGGLDVREGVLWDGAGPVVTGRGDMAYSIRPFAGVIAAEPLEGAVVLVNDSVAVVATDPSPGSGSRIDVVWVAHPRIEEDGGAGTDNAPIFGVTHGDAAGVPTVPGIPPGALALVHVNVSANATSTASLGIVQQHDWTAAAGGVVRVESAAQRAAMTVEGAIIYYVPLKAHQAFIDGQWRAVGTDDTGWVAAGALNNRLSTPGNSERLSLRAQGDTVTLSGRVQRTGASLAGGTPTESPGVVPAGFRPRCQQTAGTYGSNSNPTELHVTPGGSLIIEPQNTMGVGGFVYVSMSWARG